MRRSTVLLVAATAGIGLITFGMARYGARPVQFAAPSYADSLAGVVVRIGGRGDSAEVARVTWWQSPEQTLGWVKTDEYTYQGPSPWKDLTPIGGEADLKRFSLTFAKGQLSPELAKHELAHLLWHIGEHPASMFQRLEQYQGR